MNLKNKLNSFFKNFRGGFKAPAVMVGLLLGALSVQAGTLVAEQFSQTRNQSVLDAISLDRDPNVDYSPGYLTTWLDSLRQSNENCQSYMNTWDWFTSCEPSTSQADANEEQSPFNNLNVDQNS